MHVQDIVAVMGGRAAFTGPVSTPMDLMRGLGKGIRVEALDHVARHVYPEPGARRTLMARVVPEGTLKRRLREGRLTPAESERTARLANIIAQAEYVWRDAGDARMWLITPHPALDDHPPIEVAVDEFGARHVEYLLEAILHGLPA